METDPDVQLMLKFKAGDQEAFRQLFDRHKGRMIRYCYRFCGDQAVAEELAQEIFIRVYKAAPRYRPEARFRTWLYTIATRFCLNELRRPDYRRQFESLSTPLKDQEDEPKKRLILAGNQRPDEDVVQAEQQQMVLEAMKKLPSNQRVALLLRVEEEFSYQEIGQQIGCSENQVKTLIYRGRQKLKENLAAYFGEKT
jgi:RNA polymerase sigma-70 factor (ECF subfamily)